MIVYLNGTFIDEKDAYIPVTDRGFTLGDGVFDTLLAADGKLTLAPLHFTRLRRHAAVLGITVDTRTFEAIALDLLAHNNFRSGTYAVRTTLSRGSGPRGLLPPSDPYLTTLMTAAPITPLTGIDSVIIARTVRRNECSPLSYIKSLNYGDNILALQEAQRQGAQDALMLNIADNIACATTGNIVISEGETFITPPLTAGILDGVTRTVLLTQQNVREENISEERLRRADSLYIISSLGIKSVNALEGTPFIDRGTLSLN